MEWDMLDNIKNHEKWQDHGPPCREHMKSGNGHGLKAKQTRSSLVAQGFRNNTVI
jgi:hypothetical protein